MIDNFIFFLRKKSLCKSQQFERCNDGGIHTRTLMFMIYGVETRREKQATWERGQHEEIHSFYWFKWFDRHCEILPYHSVSICAVVFSVQCQMGRKVQRSFKNMAEKEAKQKYAQAICHKLKFNNNNRYTDANTISRALIYLHNSSSGGGDRTKFDSGVSKTKHQKIRL